MPFYGPSTATASVAANTNAVTLTGLDLTVVTPGMSISFGARDRVTGDRYLIATVTPTGTSGGSLTTVGSIPAAYASTPFLIDTGGYLGTDSSYAAATNLALLSTLLTLFGPNTNLYSGSRQLAFDKVSSAALSRVLFSTAGRSWGDLAHRALTYTPAGGGAVTGEVAGIRAYPDGTTPVDALLVDLATGGVDARMASTTMVSAATTDLSSAPFGKVALTGSATITSFGTGKHLSRHVHVVDGGATLTPGAALALPGTAAIVTRAGDCFHATSDSTGNWRVRAYQRADGTPLVLGGDTAETTVSAGVTVDLGAVNTRRVAISGGGPITSFGARANCERLVRIADVACTLTHNPASLILPTGASILAQPGDTFVANSDAAGVWRVVSYQRADGRALMASTIVAGNSGPTNIPTGSTMYFTHALASGAPSVVYVGPGRQGRFKNLRVITQAAPGAGESWTFTLQKLFSNTALTCTISGSGSNQAADLVNSVDFAANDRWSIKVVSSSGAAAMSCVLFSMTYEIVD